ncbi:MAG: hypothetical protein ABSG77_02975, partial [Candidatus Acidiferrum sp.]
MTIKRSNNPYDLCNFKYADGRFCGLPTIPSGDGMCRSHASLKRFHPSVEEELTADLVNSCLSGCFSKPQLVVYGHAAPSVCENLTRVPVDVLYRRS